MTKTWVEVLWIKGSGGDIGTMTRSGLAGLYVDKLNALKGIYRGVDTRKWWGYLGTVSTT